MTPRLVPPPFDITLILVPHPGTNACLHKRFMIVEGQPRDR